jgi:eukaryotic-like serine/threonine-protein kinase
LPSWENLLSGTVVAERYQVLRPLARGGFGAVYVAEQLATERQVALKVLWPHVLSSTKAREQFTLEARITSRINSENVVQVLDAGVDPLNDLTYIVMELLEGRDLAKLVEDGGALPPATALEYLRQTAAGLEKAHRYVDRTGRAAPIIHRDLKPDNLFLTHREDGSPLVKILDFGIAKILSQSTQMSADVKGTPLYMAYEQAARGPIGPATDIWAFGLVAFYLLSGTSYWRSGNSSDGTMTHLFAEVLSLPLVPPSQRLEELGLGVTFTPAFDAWFLRCVHRDSSQRFQSVAEALRALNAAGLEGAASSRAFSGPAHFQEAPKSTSASAEAVTLQAASTPQALHRTLEASERSVAANPANSPPWLGKVALGLGALAIAGGVLVWFNRSRSAAPDSGAPTSVAATALAAPDPARVELAPSPSPVNVASAAPRVSAAPASPSASVAAKPGGAEKAPPVATVKPAQRRQQSAKSDDDVYGDR